MNARPVAVTGIGTVSAAGLGAPALFELLVAGRSAVRPVAELDNMPAGAAPEPPADRRTHRLDRASRMFVAAAEEAWRDAALPAEPDDGGRCAVVEGSSIGSMGDLLAEHQAFLASSDHRRAHPTTLIRYMPGAGGAVVAHAHRIQGPVLHVAVGSASAMCAIGEAYLKVASGMVDVAVAGGGECPLRPEIVEAFATAGVLARGNGAPPMCRPFDPHRSGTVLGEGAGVLLLESEARARSRGARIHGFVTGYGLTCEWASMTAPDPDGAGVAASATQALGGEGAGGVGWVKTHGTGTKLNDIAECRGLAHLFGPALADVPLTSLKSTLGHCMGASGGLETCAVVLALESGFVPATVGTEEVDPELPPCRIALRPEPSAARRVLALSASFGGKCAALVLERK